MPASPLVYRRLTSREDTATDVFARLGAGTQDPIPGGAIREYSGKVIIETIFDHHKMNEFIIEFAQYSFYFTAKTKQSNELYTCC